MKRVFGLVNCLIAATLVLSLVPWWPGNGPGAAQGPVAAVPKISSRLDMQIKEKTRYIQNRGQTRPDEVLPPRLLGRSIEVASQQKVFLHSAARLSPSQLNELQSLGVAVYPDSWIPPLGNHPTGFVYAEAPVGRILDMAAKEYVSFVETAEVEIKAQNNQARLATGVNDVWNLGYNGSGVTVAVLDSGLDVTHGDIPTPTVLLDYSDYPTLDYSVANTVTGHGTHVAGTVLGRGTLSGGNYRGVAPGASLVFLKIGKDSTGGASEAAMIGAMKAAVDTFGAKVINVSYGGWSQYHDGTDEVSQAVDYAVSHGAVVVAAAGNEGADAQHYSGAVTGDSITTGFIRVNVSGPVADNSTVLSFNLVWFDGLGGHNSLVLDYYDSSFNLISSSTSSSQSESTRGTEALLTRMTGYLPSVSSGSSSTWYLKVRNVYQVNQSFHLYYSDEYNATGAGVVSFQTPDPSYTISSPAEADGAIAVGAYVTRKYWTNYLGSTYSYGPSPGQTEGSIATFSSRGPRVDAGAPGKPNLVAPGSAIISARDSVAYPWPPRSSSYAPPYIDSNYYVMQGTSMAAPHAAGIAALLLSKNPSLTPAQVKTYLQTTATDKGTAGRDDTFGYGLVNALAAVNAVPAAPPTPTPSPTPTYVPTPTPTPVPASASPISYWRFNEGTGTIATDSMGRNQGSIDGAPWATGMVGNGLSFNGSSGYVSVADSPSLGFSGDGTIEMWVKSSGASGALIWKRVYAGSQGWTLYFASPNTLVGYINSNAANVSATNVPAGQWLHVALVYESGTMKLYLNGNLVSSVNVPQGFQASNAQLLVGRDINGNYYSGLIDELAVYGKGLSHGEIWQHYLDGLAGNSYNMPTPAPTLTPTATPSPSPSPSPYPTPTLTPSPAPTPPWGSSISWVKRFGAASPEYAYDIAHDPWGNVYVTGCTNEALPGQIALGGSDAWVVKLDYAGNQMWARQFGSTTGDTARGVVADSLGNCYVAGYTSSALPGQTNSGGRFDGFLRKYDFAGNEVWTRQFGSGVDTYTYVYGAGMDLSGNVYVVGSVDNGVLVRKYDAAGNIVWASRFGAGTDIWAVGIGADQQANVYLVGDMEGPFYGQTSYGGRDVFLGKLDSSGNVAWVRQFGTGGNDYAGLNGLAIDVSGNVYVAGTAGGSLSGQGFAGIADAFLRKFDPMGNELWTREFGTAGSDSAGGVGIDQSGNVYVGGTVSGALPGQSAYGQEDAYVVAFDSSGNQVWASQLGTSSTDMCWALTLDGHGNLWGAGYSTADGSPDALVFKYASPGAMTPTPSPTAASSPSPSPSPSPTSLPPLSVGWIRQFGSVEDDIAKGVVSDSLGNAYTVGDTGGALSGQSTWGGRDSFMRKYDPSGAALFTRQFGSPSFDQGQSIVQDGQGNFLVAGETKGALPGQSYSGESDAFVRKYDSAGTEIWTRQFGTSRTDYATGIGSDGSGNSFVVGYTSGTLPGENYLGGGDAFIRKYDSSGTEIWTREFGTSAEDYATAVASDTSGNAYVVGYVAGPLPGQNYFGGGDAFIRKYDGAGIEMWTRQFGTSVLDNAFGIAVDSTGNVYVAGYTAGALSGQNSLGGEDAFIRKYNGSGVEIWTRQFGTDRVDRAYGVATDTSGNSYVAGYSSGTFPGQNYLGGGDGFVRKYDNSGAEVWTYEFGTSVTESAYAVTASGTGSIYVVGYTTGALPGQASAGKWDAFVLKLIEGPVVPSPTPSATPTPTPSPTPSPSPSPSPTPSPTPTPTPSPSPTPVPVAPVARFTMSPNPSSRVAPCTVTLTDTSTNTPTSWSWNFGDGTGSSLQDPVKTYHAAGNYTVTLTASNAAGSSSASQTVSVYSLPVAGFTDSASSGTAPLTINFTDASTGNVATWLWNFGDGTLSSTRNPSKTYSSYGSYLVTLTVTNPVGSNSASATKQVYSIPVAAFSASATSAEPGAMITFTDESSGNVTGWSWDFGDGTTGSTRNPGKIYISNGNYTVSLTASNPAGSNALTKTGYVAIVSGTVSLQSETSLVPDLDAGGYAVVHVRINRIKKAASSETFAISDGLGAYDGYITYDPAGVTVVSVVGVAPFNSPTVSLNTVGGTRTNVNAIQTTSAPVPPMNVADVRLRLRGSRELPFTATMNFATIARVGGSEAPQTGPAEFIFRRGDANSSGSVSITDALFIAQYLAGLRALGTDAGTVNAVNAASVRQDVTSPDVGDKITIADALYIAQMLAGLRDASFN